MSPPFPFIPPTLRTQSTPQPFTHPPSNGSNFSMVITISHINYPKTHLPRFTPSLFRYLLINFPLSHHFFPSTPNTSPRVYFDHSLINQFCFFFSKKYSANISPCPNNTHPHATHYLSPFQNFQLCQFSPPQHHFTSPRFPSPNFTLPTFLFHTITPPTLLISSSPKSPLQHHYCTPPPP